MATNWTTYWWGIEDEDSELCGEEFFTELANNATCADHRHYLAEIFPNENPICYGRVSEAEAEMMGLDTY